MRLIWCITSKFILLQILYCFLLRIVRTTMSQKKVHEFESCCAFIKVGMTKKQVIALMGDNYHTSFIDGCETLSWKCRKASISDPLSTTDSLGNFTYATVRLKDDVVIEYSW